MGETRGERAFTLIELLIAVLVIGILLGIGLPQLLGARRAAQDRTAQAHLRVAETAARMLVGGDTSRLAAVTATLLDGEATGLTYLDAAASTGPKVVSIGAAGGTWVAAALSAGGTCQWTTVAADGTRTTGADTATCTAEAHGPGGALPVGSGLQVWLDASAGSSLQQDAGGSVAAELDARVCRALRSPAGTAVTQASVVRCPTWRTDRWGAALDFDANGWLCATVPVGPDLSVFVVVQSDTADWNAWGWLASARDPGGFIIHTDIGARTVRFYAHDTGGYTYASAVTPANVTIPHEYTLTESGSGLVTVVAGADGVDATATGLLVTRSASTTVLALGSDGCSDTGRLGDGRYREVLVYDRALSGSERTAVESYLRAKWGTP